MGLGSLAPDFHHHILPPSKQFQDIYNRGKFGKCVRIPFECERIDQHSGEVEVMPKNLGQREDESIFRCFCWYCSCKSMASLILSHQFLSSIFDIRFSLLFFFLFQVVHSWLSFSVQNSSPTCFISLQFLFSGCIFWKGIRYLAKHSCYQLHIATNSIGTKKWFWGLRACFKSPFWERKESAQWSVMPENMWWSAVHQLNTHEQPQKVFVPFMVITRCNQIKSHNMGSHPQ